MVDFILVFLLVALVLASHSSKSIKLFSKVSSGLCYYLIFYLQNFAPLGIYPDVAVSCVFILIIPLLSGSVHP